MKVEVITIGDEILIGQIVNTNAAWLGVECSKLGLEIIQTTTIKDRKNDIIFAVEKAINHADIVFVTGGLGPTNDDITKITLTNFFGTELVRNTEIEANLEAWFTARGRILSDMNRAQADLPKAAEIIPNTMGTASGMWFEKNGIPVISMPGVPYEMKSMVKNEIFPRIQQRFQLPFIFHRTLMVAGIVESSIAQKLKNIEAEMPHFLKLAYLPKPGIVRLRLSAVGENEVLIKKTILEFENKISEELKNYHYGFDEITLEETIGKILKAKNLTVGTAESCTGGKITHKITSISGSSDYFKGGIVAYDNSWKETLLGVDSQLIQKYGAVSEEVANKMSLGLKQKMGVDYAIATTGIAGPTGGSDQKPVGTVWISIAGPNNVMVQKYSMGTDREFIIERSSMQALYLMWQMLQKI